MIDMKHVTQEERLDYPVEAFKADSGKYKDIETPKDIEGKKKKSLQVSGETHRLKDGKREMLKLKRLLEMKAILVEIN